MKTEIFEVYDDLNILLKDICSFLSEEVKNGTLSAKAANRANVLIQRSKVKLEEIAKVVPNDTDSGRYIDMQTKTVALTEYVESDIKTNADEHQEIYTDVDNEEVTDFNIIECPYISLPAKELPLNEKHEFIIRKEKILGFVDHQKKLYAGICGEWLLLYRSKTDCKPFETIFLKQYTLSVVPKKELSFDLIPKSEQGKLHQFSGLAKKDMRQWFSAILSIIESRHASISNKPLPVIPPQIDNNDDPQEIYSELECDMDLTNHKQSQQSFCVLPDSLPEENYDETEEIYDHITNPPQQVEDEEEDIYDIITPSIRPLENGYDDGEEIYDFIQADTVPEQPIYEDENIFTPAPEVSPQKSKFSFFSRKIVK